MTNKAASLESSGDPTSLSARAYKHIQVLVEEIGPRPAGSNEERRAHNYVADQLADWGYRVERLAAPFAPLPHFSPLNAIAGLALALGSWQLHSRPWIVIGLPLLLISLPTLARVLIRRRSRVAQSENVLAYRAVPDRKPMLIFCAHIDSARASAFRGQFWLWLQSKQMFIAQRMALLAAAMALLNLSGIELSDALVRGVGWGGSLAGGWMVVIAVLNQLAHRGDYSPGAHDNASGVGVVLALAQHFMAEPPHDPQLGFLITGAEETGLHGAAAFATQLSRAGQSPTFVNLDMVGAGDTLRFITREGTLFPLRTSQKLNALVQDTCTQAQPLAYTMRSGDFAAFVRQGFPTTALQTSGSARAEMAYHTVHDNLDVIDVAALEMTTRAAIDFVEEFRNSAQAG